MMLVRTMVALLLAGSVGCTGQIGNDGGDGGRDGAVVTPSEDGGSTPGTDGGGVPGTDGGGGPGTDAGSSPDAGALPTACEPAAEAPTPTASVTYYFSDCAFDAEPGCVPGDDARPGTDPDAPRRSLAGIDVDVLPAGTHLLFARGGAWAEFHVRIRNLNATPEQPIVFGAYTPSWGGTARPSLHTTSDTGIIELGNWADDRYHGGYVVRDVRLEGYDGEALWGVWIPAGGSHITIHDIEITGFHIGIHVQGQDVLRIQHLTLLRVNVHHNHAMGMLAHADDLRVEDSIFSFNNFSGSALNHGMYLGGRGGTHAVIRNNVLERNSAVDGECLGGNFTMHGPWEDVLIEGNVILQDRSALSCYGISLMTSYTTPEHFRGFTIRGNTIVNLGGHSIGAQAAPGIVIENNLIVNDNAISATAIALGHPEVAPGDDADHDGIIRNNTIIHTGASPYAVGIRANEWAGTGVVVVSNLVSYGPLASAGDCFFHGPASGYAAFANNLCHGGSWSDTLATLSAAQAAGLDADGSDAAPGFSEMPSAANGWVAALEAASPAVDHGHATMSSERDRACMLRSPPDIGAFER